MIERLYNPINVGLALSVVSPKSEEMVRLTGYDNHMLWKKRPYAHEFALIRASFGLLERRGRIDQTFSDNMAFLLMWISQLDQTAFKKRTGRAEPLFMDQRSKEQINDQIMNLQRVGAVENSDTIIRLSFFLSSCVRELAEFNIIDNSDYSSGPNETDLV